MSVATVILVVIAVVVLIVVAVYLYNRYMMTPATPTGDLARAQAAIDGSIDEFQSAYNDDTYSDDTYADKKGAFAAKKDAFSAKKASYAGKKASYADKKASYAGKKGAYADKKAAYAGKKGAYSQDADDIASDVRNVWAGLGDEIDNMDVSCVAPRHMMDLKKKLMGDKQHLSEMNQSCRPKAGRKGRSPRGKMSGDDFDCGEFDYSRGGHCLQDTPAGKKCFRSGNSKDGGKGWYKEADMEMCDGRPTCGDVMLRCQGYDPTDY